MAQTMASSPSCRTAPFPSPPGLEAPHEAQTSLANVASEAKAAALESVEDKLNQSGVAGPQRSAIIEGIRNAVMHDVDLKVAEKAEELWQKGQKALKEIQRKQDEKNKKLSEEVAKCRDNQRVLESENDQLKQVLASLANRFQLLGRVFSDPNAEGAASSAAEDDAVVEAANILSRSPPHGQQDGLSEVGTPASAPFTPGAESFGSGMSDANGHMKLPAVPAFPLPPARPESPAATLSLAEALGQQTPQRTPLSLESSLTPAASPDAAGSRSLTGSMFSFTLRKADGAELGLNVSHHETDRVLRVEGVRPDGAVEAWNRQCAGSSAAEKAVLTGDKIVSVNNITYNPQKMLEECRDRQLLRLTILRGDKDNMLPVPPGMPTPGEKSPASTAAAKAKNTVLRADASVFVPMGAGQQATDSVEADASETDAAERVTC